MRMGLFELSHLADGTPTEIAIACVAKVGIRDLLKATRRVEPGGDFVREALVLDETMLARQLDRLLVEAHRVEVAAFDASHLCRHQGVFIKKCLWTALCPFSQLLQRLRERFAPFGLPFRSSRFIKH